MSRFYEVITGPQAAGVAVVRVWGEGESVRHGLSGCISRLPTSVGRVSYGDMRKGRREGGELVDDVVVGWVGGVVGEELEISCHGGPEVVRQVCGVLAANGFESRQWSAGSASDEDRIERAISRCQTELALRVLLAQRGQEAESSTQGNALYHLLHPPTVAIVGPANVGKSTLINALSRQDAAIVADLPGTTRDYVLAEADVAPELGGFIIRLMDTPGLRESSDPIERAAIKLAKQEIARASLILLVINHESLRSSEVDVLRSAYPNALKIWNQSDLFPAPPGWTGLSISARTGDGLCQLRHAICSHFGILPGVEKCRWQF